MTEPGPAYQIRPARPEDVDAIIARLDAATHLRALLPGHDTAEHPVDEVDGKRMIAFGPERVVLDAAALRRTDE